MAHEIDLSNGRENFAFVGDTAWHGLGVKLEPNMPLEHWAVQAGMNWKLESSPVYYGTPELPKTFPDRKAYFRSDNGAPLAVVSNDHREVHPGEVLEFFRELTEGAGFELETAGCLFGGRKFWAMAKVGKGVKIMNQDEIRPYLLLGSSCDGSMATSAQFTSVRVVCSNTLRMAIGAHGEKAAVRVPHMAKWDPEDAKEKLGLKSEDAWENFIGNINKLAKFKIHRGDAIDVVAKELKDEWLTEGDERLSESTPLALIIKLFDGSGLGADLKSSKGTGWGLLNAVTEYADHHTAARSAEKRFERANFTNQASFKTSVANKLLVLAS